MKTLLVVIASLFSFSAMATHQEDSVIVSVGGKSKIIVYGTSKEDIKRLLKYDLNKLMKEVGVKIDSTAKDGVTRIDLGQIDSEKYEKNEKNSKIDISIGDRHITIGEPDSTGTPDSTDRGKVSVKRLRSNREWWKNDKDNFVVSLGLNTFNNKTSAGYNANEFDLRPWGSRFVSLGFYRNPVLVKGRNAALRLKTGIEFSWYNFMFEGNNVAQNGANRVLFPESSVALSKSKLTASYINVPFVPTFITRKGVVSSIGIGGYAGYRLGSHTKTKTEGGNKDRIKGGFSLENFRYGVTAEIGFRGASDIFINYDLNNLFQANRGPGVQAISFGFRLN